MRVSIASIAVLLLLVSGHLAEPAAAEPSPDAAAGVAAYEAGDYARAYELLKPVADAGGLQARYLMARLLSGEPPKYINYPAALAYLEPKTRCQSPQALALYGFVLWKVRSEEIELVEAAFAYKQAASAGVIEAHASLGVLLVREFSRPYEGAAYLLEAARLGDQNGIEFIEYLKSSELGGMTLDHVRSLVEEQPFDQRWPLLDEKTTHCQF